MSGPAFFRRVSTNLLYIDSLSSLLIALWKSGLLPFNTHCRVNWLTMRMLYLHCRTFASHGFPDSGWSNIRRFVSLVVLENDVCECGEERNTEQTVASEVRPTYPSYCYRRLQCCWIHGNYTTIVDYTVTTLQHLWLLVEYLHPLYLLICVYSRDAQQYTHSLFYWTRTSLSNCGMEG